MGPWSYLAMLGFVVIASWWLEWFFKLRVLRNPKRLVLTLAFVIPFFILWDAFAISRGYWSFDFNQMTGLKGPFGVPAEEYLFFLIIPIAVLLTWEGVLAFLKILSVRRAK